MMKTEERRSYWDMWIYIAHDWPVLHCCRFQITRFPQAVHKVSGVHKQDDNSHRTSEAMHEPVAAIGTPSSSENKSPASSGAGLARANSAAKGKTKRRVNFIFEIENFQGKTNEADNQKEKSA